MSARERLKDNRPYWKIMVSLVFSLTATVLLIVIGIRAIFYFMPFVIGWILALIAGPIVGFLERRLNITKKLGSAITIILVLAAAIGLIYLAGSMIWEEGVSLAENFPVIYREINVGFHKIGDGDIYLVKALPAQVREVWDTLLMNLDRTIGRMFSQISEPMITLAGNMAKRIPSVLIGTIVAFVSAYFFVSDKEGLNQWIKKVVPDPITSRMLMVGDNLKYAMGGYFKAQFKIMGVVFFILFVGFSVLRIHFSILLAIVIAVLDFLPFFGTGTALIPWAIYQLLIGNYKRAIALIIIYGITQIVRQLIQPKLVGDSMGLNPLYTLFLLYLGYRMGSVLGLIFAVPIGLILLNLFKAGAFDYILNDVELLAEGVLSMRNIEGEERPQKKNEEP